MNPPLLGEGLRDRGVIVTGGASGIGRSTVNAMAAAGARVAVVDRDAGGIADTIAGLDQPQRHLALAYDLSEVAGLPGLVAEVRRAFGDLWALVRDDPPRRSAV